jgi:hypothetical protein
MERWGLGSQAFRAVALTVIGGVYALMPLGVAFFLAESMNGYGY